MEEWVKVSGYEKYSVSSFGNIRRNSTGLVLKPQILRTGYYIVTLCKPKIRKSFTIHGVVARNFLGDTPEGKQINHKDGNKLNNRLENLEYLTRAENCQHAVLKGLWVNNRGSRCGSSKLKGEDVKYLRYLRFERNWTQNELSKKFGVSRRHVSDIVNNICWKET